MASRALENATRHRSGGRDETSALATDYDGTIAHDGAWTSDAVAALGATRSPAGGCVLVTGRELDDLFAMFRSIDRLRPDCRRERRALLYDPATKAARSSSPPPPPRWSSGCAGEGVPLSVGRSIVATVEPHEHAVLAAIRDLGLEWHVIFNKGSVMALPSGVTKATGLAPALEDREGPAGTHGRRRRRRERPRVPAAVRPVGGRRQRAAVAEGDGRPRDDAAPRRRRVGADRSAARRRVRILQPQSWDPSPGVAFRGARLGGGPILACAIARRR